MRLIDADNIDFSHSSKELYPLLHYVLDLFDAQPTIKAYTKDEVIAMLTELKSEIREEIKEDMCIRDSKAEMGFYRLIKDSDVENIIQQKIDALKGNTMHWIDNADSYICPICNYETRPNPVKYSYKCPRCGFVDSNDIEKINALKEDK